MLIIRIGGAGRFLRRVSINANSYFYSPFLLRLKGAIKRDLWLLNWDPWILGDLVAVVEGVYPLKLMGVDRCMG